MRILVLLFVFGSFSLQAQLSGKLREDGRKMMTVTNYIQAGSVDGYAKYDISVNAKGEVTSAKLIETDLKSTPATWQLKNTVLKFKFEPGTYWPKYHHGVVKLTMSTSLEALD